MFLICCVAFFLVHFATAPTAPTQLEYYIDIDLHESFWREMNDEFLSLQDELCKLKAWLITTLSRAQR